MMFEEGAKNIWFYPLEVAIVQNIKASGQRMGSSTGVHKGVSIIISLFSVTY